MAHTNADTEGERKRRADEQPDRPKRSRKSVDRFTIGQGGEPSAAGASERGGCVDSDSD